MIVQGKNKAKKRHECWTEGHYMGGVEFGTNC